LTLKPGAGAAFKRAIEDLWEFASLDTFIIQPISAMLKPVLKTTKLPRI
jgi:hypothetical protein